MCHSVYISCMNMFAITDYAGQEVCHICRRLGVEANLELRGQNVTSDWQF